MSCHVEKTRSDGSKLQQERFHLDTRHFFTVRTINNVVQPPSLEAFEM